MNGLTAARVVLLFAIFGVSANVSSSAAISDTLGVQLASAAVVIGTAQDDDVVVTVWYDPILCLAILPCRALPISLPAVNTTLPGSGDLRVEVSGSKCGWKWCWRLICACGDPLAGGVCP